MDRIAHDILEKCKIVNVKSDNNNKRLQCKQGKLSITNGLTIKEFEKKFSINNINNTNSSSNRILFSPNINNNNNNSFNFNISINNGNNVNNNNGNNNNE
jgi:hypothetical protein